MGKRGPPPLPTETKRRRGTLQPCRTNADEPVCEVAEPPRPAWLSTVALAAWDDAVEHGLAMGVLSRHDGPAALLYAVAHERLTIALEAYRRQGPITLTETESGGTVERRSVAARELDAATKEYHRALRELGRSPSSRSSVSVIAAPQVESEHEREKRALLAMR